VPQREAQLVAEGFAGPVPLIEDGPAPVLPAARLDMLAGDGARLADGRADAEAMNKESPAREPCVRRNCLLLKGSHAIIIKGLRFCGHGIKGLMFCGHGRKLPFVVEINYYWAAMVENKYITTRV
jgi:hypothetical protein